MQEPRRNLIYRAVPRVYLLKETWIRVVGRGAREDEGKAVEKIETIAGSVHDHIGNEAPGVKTYLIFSYMKFTQRSKIWNPGEIAHCKQTGWLLGKRIQELLTDWSLVSNLS